MERLVQKLNSELNKSKITIDSLRSDNAEMKVIYKKRFFLYLKSIKLIFKNKIESSRENQD